MSKYRFKTGEEFIRDGLWGEEFNCPYSWNSEGKMNKYLGQDIPEKFNDTCDKGVGFRYENWNFSSNDYILKENYVGRTIKALIDNPNESGVKKGEQIKIIGLKSTYYEIDETSEGLECMRIEYPLNLSHWEVLPEINTKTPVDMKAIQEEAKKRFPIGCKFYNTNGEGIFTLLKDDYVYEIRETKIWAHEYSGCLYNNGKWAELISLPEPVSINEFKRGDYIVTLDVESGAWNCAKNNYCFKQRVDSKGIYPAVDLVGSKTNGHDSMSFDKKKYLKEWRYATPEEIAEYDRIGKPYDVTTLQNKKKESMPEYVKCVRGLNNATVGKIYKVIDASYCESNSPTQKYSWQTPDFKPSTKEAYEAQLLPKKLTKKDLIEGEIYIYDNAHISTYPEGPSFSIFSKIYSPKYKWEWILSIKHATEEQKTLLRSEIEKYSSKTIPFEEYTPQVGDYVVMEKAGGWGYSPDNNGCIAIVEKVSEFPVNHVKVLSISGQVINAKNKEHINFTNVPIIGHDKERIFRKALPHEIPSNLPKKDVIKKSECPLEICRQKYKKGMVVKSAEESGMYSGTFTINANPEKFKKIGDGVDYFGSEGFLYYHGKYAEILSYPDEQSKLEYSNSKDSILNEITIQKETFIEDVQSVDVMLRTKRKSIKF